MKTVMRLLCFLVCVSVCGTALAAPNRDVRQAAGTNAALETAASLFGGAALLRDVYQVTAGEPTPQAMAEGTLLLGYARHLLPSADGNPADETETADAETLRGLLAGLFAAEAAVPEAPSCPCITRSGDALTFDLTGVDMETAGGAYIFSSWREGGQVMVLADLYAAIAYFGEEMSLIPEDCVTWIRTALMALEPAPDSPVGYRLVSMTAYPDWLDGAPSEWELTLGEDYEISLPTFFALSQSEGGADVYVADGVDARLTIETVPVTGDDPLSAARADYAAAHPDAAIVMEPALSHFTAETDGQYVLYVCPENTDQMRVLTLTFPSERQYEFSFYGEIIRNSFWCEGIGLG